MCGNGDQYHLRWQLGKKMWQIIIHFKVYLPSHLNRIISVSTGSLFYKFPQKLLIKKGIKGVTTKQPCKQIVKITRNNQKKKSRKRSQEKKDITIQVCKEKGFYHWLSYCG